MEQKLKDLLTEQGIALEPATPPGKTVSTLIQRGWNLLFGRKGTFLYAAHVERLGGLMVMPFEGLIAPDYCQTYTLDSTNTEYDQNFATARPRISEIRTTQALTASPYTLSSSGILFVYDGTVAAGTVIAHAHGGAQVIWVYTAAQYLGLEFIVAAAVNHRVNVRSWNL